MTIALKNILKFRKTSRLFYADLISSLLLIVFLYTAWSKLRDYDQFKHTLNQSPLLQQTANIIAWLLPVSELVIVALLFIPHFRKPGLWVSAILISAFTIYLTYMVMYTPQLPCTCGGILSELSWRQHIALNILLILISSTGIVLYKRNNTHLNKSPP